jgi:hypothetical protein
MGSTSVPRYETPEENRKRLASYVAGKDPLQMQAAAPHILSQLIEGVADDELRRRPAPSKWSVVEIIAHLADDELVTAWRYHQMIEHDGEKLWSFDQDRWAELGSYALRDTKEALNLFCLLRQTNLRMLDRLSPEEWRREGQHTERGHMTVRDLATHMAAHDINHIEQIRRMLHKD